jgi:hypothetical protein
MKLRTFIAAMFILAFLGGGCGGGDGGPTNPGGTPAPAITDVDPASVTVGTVVTVTGTGFGSSGQLLVNGSAVATTSWSDTTIVFTVPAGYTGTELQLRVTSGGQDSSDFALAYTEPAGGPVITSCDPPRLAEGIVALLYGSNFGTAGELYVNGDVVATTSWTDGLIIFTVPVVLSGSQLNIWVVVDGLNSGSFHVPFIETTERQLTFDGMGCNAPCWGAGTDMLYFSAQAPDGTMAFYQVPFGGGDTTLLYNGPGNDYFLDVQYYQASAVIWVSDRTEGGNTDGDWEIREGSAGFNPQGWVIGIEVGTNESYERLPVWSHSERLNVDCAWTQDRQAGNSMIYIRHHATAKDLVSGYMPCFNPTDGTYLAYLTPSGGTGYDIMKIRAEQGSTGELIYRDEQTSQTALAWGAGGHIAYKRGLHIWIMDEDGTNHRKLTDGYDAEFAPKFSPNGNWVVFTRMTTTGHEVFVAKVPQ